MATHTLTDLTRDVWTESFSERGADWSVSKRVLRGGRRDGVELVEVDNGSLSFKVVPTRGMGLWKGAYQGRRLGWDSPIRDGPVHPSLVRPIESGGIGWLDGFDEWLVRCGLSHNGAPFEETIPAADGTHRHVVHALHGPIGNTPAHYLAVEIDEPAGSIAVEGRTIEGRLFASTIELTTRYVTTLGSNRLLVRDEFRNLGDRAIDFQILYHWNFGPPYLEAGARWAAPLAEIAPRNPHAATNLNSFDLYEGPRPGFEEQVFLCKLIGDGPGGRSLALLRDAQGEHGVVLRFSTAELPCFIVWKNTGGPRDGYVTGLEPSTNYPNPFPFEKNRGRTVALAPDASRVAETTLEILEGSKAVAEAVAEIAELQRRAAPVVHSKPEGSFSPI